MLMAWGRFSVPRCLAAQIIACCLWQCPAENVLRVAQLGNLPNAYGLAFKDFAVPYINANKTIQLNGASWTIEVVEYDLTNTDEATAVTAASNGLDLDGNAVGDIHVIAAATSKKNKPIIEAAQAAGIPQLHMSGGNPAMWKAQNTFAFGMHLPFITYTRGPLRIAGLRGLKTIMIVSTAGHGFSRLSCVAALEWARESGLEVVGPTPAWCRANAAGYSSCRVVIGSNGEERCSCGAQADVDGYGFGYNIEEVPTFYELHEAKIGNGLVKGVVDANTTEFARGMFQDVAAQGKVPDIVLNFAQEGQNVLRAMYQENFVPKMTLGWHGGTLASWAEASDADGTGMDMTAEHGYWAVGFGQWHKAMTLADPVFGTNARTVSLFEDTMGRPLSYDMAGGIATSVVLYKALGSYVDSDFEHLTIVEQRDKLRLGIGQMNDETMWGVIRFNRFNQNSGRGTAAWQIIPDASKDPQQLCILPTEAQEVEMQIPFPSWESRFGCPAGTFNTLSECVACGEGTFRSGTGPGMEVTACDTCPAGVGTLPAATGSNSCNACPAGRSNEGDVGLCEQCAGGKYRNDTMSECSFCPPGTRSMDAAGSTTCIDCTPGTFSQFRGSSQCTDCAAGSFTDTPGSSECQKCSVGSYMQEAGKSACIDCGKGKQSPELWDTLQELTIRGALEWVALEGASSEGACGCRKGAYPVGSECVECTEGMSCPGMKMTIEPGYYSAAETPGFVFQCFSADDRCPGGAPGTCASGRDADVIACAGCLEHMKQAADGSCEPCEGTDYLPLIIALLVATCLVFGIYWMVDHESQAKQSHTLLLVGIACGQAITISQQLGVLNALSVGWPSPFTRLLDIGLVLNFDLDVLHLECLSPTSPLAQYSQRVFCVVFFFLLMISIHVFYVTGIHHMQFAAHKSTLIGSTGAIFMAFFISIVSSILAPFQCNSNPNGLYTVRSYMSVVCWEWDSYEEHRGMIIVACIGVLIPCTFLAYCAWALTRVPDAVRDGDNDFLHANSFLIFRFRPGAYWYAVVFLVRNALVAATPVWTSSFTQILFMQVVLLPCLMLTVYTRPWRVPLANVLDICCGVAILLVLNLAAFISDTSYNEDVIAGLCCAAFAVSFLGALMAVVFAVWLRYFRTWKPYKFFICHHKAGAGNLARLFKMLLVERPGVGNRVFVDSDDLGNLSQLFGYVANDTETLVVLCSAEIYSRPWCVGEMTTSKANGVNVMPVVLADFKEPTEDFFTNYHVYVPDVRLLANYGMDQEMALEAIRWVMGLPVIQFGSQTNMDAAKSCLDKLLGVSRLSRRGSVDRMPSSRGSEIAMVVDTRSSEAICSALALQKLLAKLHVGNLARVPVVLGEEDSWPESAKQALLVCSNGCFTSPVVTSFLLQAMASKDGIYMLPVISENGFRFPTASFYKEIYTSEYMSQRADFNRQGSKGTDGASSDDTEAAQRALTYVAIIKRVFVEIAIEFNPQDSEDAMVVRAKAVSDRLKGAVCTLSSDLDTEGSRQMLDLKAEGQTMAEDSSTDVEEVISSKCSPALEV